MASTWEVGDARDPTGHLALEFKSIDTDGNGMLDEEELRTGLLKRDWKEEDVKGMFSKISKDGTVTLDQFLDKMTSLAPPTSWWNLDQRDERRLQSAFYELDRDNNKELDEEERKEGMKEGGALAKLLIEFGLSAKSLDSLRGAVDFAFFRQRFVREYEITRKKQALLRADMERAIAACIPGGTPSDPLGGLEAMGDDEFKAFCRDKVAERIEVVLRKERVRLSKIKDEKVSRDSGLEASPAGEGNAKFDLGSGMKTTATFGKIDDFHSGLAEAIGLPTRSLLQEMEAEHTNRGDSESHFDPGNYSYLQSTTPKNEWSVVTGDDAAAQKAVKDSKGKRQIKKIDDLMKIADERFPNAGLCKVEVLALQLYTGPMFAVYNTVLRKFPADKLEALKGNRYTHTIYCIVSGIIKLSKVMVLPEDRKVYRGLRNLELPDEFIKPNQYGVTGGVEMAMLSTTLNKEVALQYAGEARDEVPIIFEINLGAIDRGANITWLSQYPNENEILFPPRSYLEVVDGGSRVEELGEGGGAVRVVSLHVNANVASQTIEQIEGRRKEFFKSASDAVQLEIQASLMQLVESDEVSNVLKTRPKESYDDKHHLLQKKIEQEVSEWVSSYKDRPNEWFVDDFHYSKLVRELTGLKMMAVEKFEYWKVGPAGHMRDNIEETPMEHVFRRREVQMMNELWECSVPGTKSLGRSTSSIGGATEEHRKDLALELCKRRGALMDEVDEENSLGEPPIVAAGVRGDLMHLKLLSLAGCDLQAQARDGSTALHRACMMGNLVFAKHLIEKGADLYTTDENGMTCLHVALDLGQTEMVQLLLEVELKTMDEDTRGRIANQASPSAFASFDSQEGVPEPLWMRKTRKKPEGPLSREELVNGGKADTCAILACQGGHLKSLNALVTFVEKEYCKEQADELLMQFNEMDGTTCAIAAASMGHRKVLEKLFERCPELLWMLRFNGSSVAYVAAETGHTKILQYLCELPKGGPELLKHPDEQNTTPAYIAAQNGHVDTLEYLLEQSGCKELFQTCTDGQTVAYAAASWGRDEALKCIQERLQKLDGSPVEGFPDEWRGRMKVMLDVLDDGYSCACSAAEKGSVAVLKMMHEWFGEGVFFLASQTQEVGCAYAACEEGQLGVLKFLGDTLGPRILMEQTTDRETCAHMVARDPSAHKLMRYLADKCDADFFLKCDFSGRSCAHLAAAHGSVQALEIIANKELFMQLDDEFVSCAYRAAENGHVGALRVLAKAGKEVLELGGGGWSCAEVASMNGHVQVGGTELLAATTVHENSPAHLAAEHCRVGVLKFFADTEGLCDLLAKPDNRGHTPAYVACQHGHLAALEVILASPRGKEALMVVDNDGYSCAFIAAATADKGPRSEMLKLLFKEGGRELFMLVGNSGMTVAHACCWLPDDSLIRSLLEMSGALRRLLKATTKDGFNCTDTALCSMYLCRDEDPRKDGHRKVAEYLVEVWGVQGVKKPQDYQEYAKGPAPSGGGGGEEEALETLGSARGTGYRRGGGAR